MHFTPLLLALHAVPPQVAVNPCPWPPIDHVVAPGPDETGVPLNTSIWVRLGIEHPDTFSVVLRDLHGERVIGTRAEVLYAFPAGDAHPIESAVRYVPDEALAPDRPYEIAWRSGSGQTGGHLFVTGASRDESRPAAPVVARAMPFSPYNCGSVIGVAVEVEAGSVEATPPLLLGTANGAVRGFGRGVAVAVPVDEPQVAVTGTLVALDLAGNRSEASGAYQATTPEPFDPSGPTVGGCQCVAGGRGSLGAVALALVGMAIAARRMRGGAVAGSARSACSAISRMVSSC